MSKEIEVFTDLKIITKFNVTSCEVEGEVYWRYGEDEWSWLCGDNLFDVDNPETLEAKYQQALRRDRLNLAELWGE